MQNSKINLIGAFWLVSAVFICVISRLLDSTGPDFDNAGFYIIGNISYILICFLIRPLIGTRYNQSDTFISFPIFLLGAVILIFAPPLFENDHYRYIWEAKVLLHGENPYIEMPNSAQLNFINFTKKDLIGFPHLTSIYPPLAITWFSLGALFSFTYSMLILKLLNILLVFYLLKFLNRFKPHLFNLLLIFPYIQKEFISSIHIDLFAVSFLLLSFYYLHKKKAISIKILTGVILSFWSKFLSILIVPFLLLATEKKDLFKSLILLFISMPIGLLVFFFLFIKDFNLLLGVKAFSSTWFWHPGFFTFLTEMVNIEHKMAREVTGLAFLIYYLFLMVKFLLIKFENRQKHLPSIILLVFSGLIFFSPVFNPWYAIWFLPFAIIRHNTWGVIYASFSFLSYTAYGHSQYLHYTQLINHIIFLPLLVTELRRLQKTPR